jgi:hypothetical protein
MRSTVLIIHSAKLNGTRHVPTQYSSYKANVVYSTFHLQLPLPSIFTFKKGWFTTRNQTPQNSKFYCTQFQLFLYFMVAEKCRYNEI